jgi:hypothetical protein
MPTRGCGDSAEEKIERFTGNVRPVASQGRVRNKQASEALDDPFTKLNRETNSGEYIHNFSGSS